MVSQSLPHLREMPDVRQTVLWLVEPVATLLAISGERGWADAMNRITSIVLFIGSVVAILCGFLIVMLNAAPEILTEKKVETLKKVNAELRGEINAKRQRSMLTWCSYELEMAWDKLEQCASELNHCRNPTPVNPKWDR